jgi:hypothetical protein
VNQFIATLKEYAALGWHLAPPVLGHAQFGHDGFHHRVRHRCPQGIHGDLVREFGPFLKLAYHASHEMAPCDRWL